MDERVIERAKELLSAEQSGMDDLLADLESERRRLRADAQKAAELRAEAERVKGEHDRIADQLKRRRAKLEEEMVAEVKRDLSRAKAQIRDAVRRVRDEPRGAVAEDRLRGAGGAGGRCARRSPRRSTTRRRSTPRCGRSKTGPSVREGEEVYVAPIHANGRVVVLPDARGRVTVQVRGSPVDAVGRQAAAAARASRHRGGPTGVDRYAGRHPAPPGGRRRRARRAHLRPARAIPRGTRWRRSNRS